MSERANIETRPSGRKAAAPPSSSAPRSAADVSERAFVRGCAVQTTPAARPARSPNKPESMSTGFAVSTVCAPSVGTWAGFDRGRHDLLDSVKQHGACYVGRAMRARRRDRHRRPSWNVELLASAMPPRPRCPWPHRPPHCVTQSQSAWRGLFENAWSPT